MIKFSKDLNSNKKKLSTCNDIKTTGNRQQIYIFYCQAIRIIYKRKKKNISSFVLISTTKILTCLTFRIILKSSGWGNRK